MQAHLLASLRSLQLGLKLILLSASRLLSGLYLTLPLGHRQIFPLQQFAFGLIAPDNTVTLEQTLDRASSDPILVGQSILGPTFKIGVYNCFVDRIASRSTEYVTDCHVFNLQTPSEMYAAEGIISKLSLQRLRLARLTPFTGVRMPLTAKGRKILQAMREQYGERAEEVFYSQQFGGSMTSDVGWTPASRAAATATKSKSAEQTPGSKRGPAGSGEGSGESSGGPTPPPGQHLGNAELPKKKKKPSLKRDPESYEEEVADKRRRKIQARDPMGREAGTYEEEDSMNDDLFEMVGDAACSQRLSMRDTIQLEDRGGVIFTRDGVLKANPRIARTGIQLYCGDECGRPDMETVRVFRPETSVFATDAVRSYTNLPVTLDHPPEMVSTMNWRKYAIGDTGEDVLREGGTVRVPMMLRDAAAIQAFKQGSNQLSVGYECDLAWTPGVTDDGEEYDAVQSNIRANHLAVVTNARGGEQLKIGDDGQRGDSAMNLKNVTVDGIECQMTDTAAALVSKTIKALNDRHDKLTSELDAWKKKKDKDDDDAKDSVKKAEDALKAKDAEIAVLNKKVTDAEWTPERIEDEIGKRMDVIDKARAFLGDKLVSKGKSLNDIRKQVVDAHMGDVAKDWDAVKIEAGFAAITKDAKRAAAGSTNTFSDAVRAFAQPMHPGNVGDAQAVKDRAYDERVKAGEDAWKTLGQVAQ